MIKFSYNTLDLSPHAKSTFRHVISQLVTWHPCRQGDTFALIGFLCITKINKRASIEMPFIQIRGFLVQVRLVCKYSNLYILMRIVLLPEGLIARNKSLKILQ